MSLLNEQLQIESHSRHVDRLNAEVVVQTVRKVLRLSRCFMRQHALLASAPRLRSRDRPNPRPDALHSQTQPHRHSRDALERSLPRHRHTPRGYYRADDALSCRVLILLDGKDRRESNRMPRVDDGRYQPHPTLHELRGGPGCRRPGKGALRGERLLDLVHAPLTKIQTIQREINALVQVDTTVSRSASTSRSTFLLT